MGLLFFYFYPVRTDLMSSAPFYVGPESELHELLYVLILELVLAPDEGVQPGGRHEGGPDSFDLLNVPTSRES